MADFDDLFPDQSKKQEKRSYNEEVWKKEKKQERDAVYALLDETTEKIVSDPKMFQQYLDVQSGFDHYSASNAVLILAQKPDATQVKDFNGWKNEGVAVPVEAKRIQILEPGKTYTKQNGDRGTYYKVKKVIDVSDVQGAAKREAVVRPDDRLLIQALISKRPVPIENVDEMPNQRGAFYDHDKKKIFVLRGMSADILFRSLATELAHANMAREYENYDRRESGFAAYCTSYILCKKFGVDVASFRFDQVPMELKGRKPAEIRGELEAVRRMAHSMTENINRSLGRKPHTREKEQER